MNKIIVLLLYMGILHNVFYGQTTYQLAGTVVDENNGAIAGASVFLYPIKKGTITDADGKFFIGDLLKGTYRVEISFIGYISFIDTVTFNKNITLNANLEATSLSLQEVVVTDKFVEARKKEQSLNVEIVNEEYLKQNLGGSIMNSLERLPGVSTIDIGSGQAKPVIRGLGFNRVVVVENNIKHEAQQWGADHGLEIDQYALDDIEIIKGPASLMYGSDAIGGVIDMKKRKVPVENSFGGTVDLTGKTNNDFVGTSLSVYGRKKWFFADARATFLDYGDYKVPSNSVDIYSYKANLYKNHLRNTAGKEQNLHFTMGVIQKNFQSKLFMSNVNSKSGFFANAHGLEPRRVDTDLHDKSNRDIQYPYQSVNHFKLISISQFQLEKTKIEFDLGFQHNFREELNTYTSHGLMPPVFPDTLPFPSDLERQFDKNVYSGNMKVLYDFRDNMEFNFGLNSEYQHNDISGVSFLIPAYKQLNLGGFAFTKYRFSEISVVQLGIRYDYGIMNTEEYNDWYPPFLQRAWKINRKFSSVSWSVGYNYNSEKWTYKINVGKSFRMPIAKEQAANGVERHMFRYVIGDANLNPEVSWQLDAGIEYNARRFAIGASPFLNYFSNYIYLNPTSEHDHTKGQGNQKFYYTESEVFRYGGEIHAHYELIKSLQLGFLGEYVYSEQLSGDKKGFSLPFSPPASIIFNVKYKKQRLIFLNNTYLSIDYRLVAPQNDIVPPEEPTNGYQVVNVNIGCAMKLKNQNVNISFQVQNLLNKKYFNHTSYYRMINVPEQGRNIVMNISVPFDFGWSRLEKKK